MPLFGLLLFAITAVLLGSAPASADERGFLALFEGQPEAAESPPLRSRSGWRENIRKRPGNWFPTRPMRGRARSP